MSDESKSSRPSPVDMTDFGIFYPIGYIVAGFPDPGSAEQVQRDLTSGGYEPQDCLLLSAGEVATAAKRNLDENTGFLARLGRNDEMVQVHLNAANKGATFLLIYAPGEVESNRAMNVVRRVPFAFAHRYHRLAIEDLQ